MVSREHRISRRRVHDGVCKLEIVPGQHGSDLVSASLGNLYSGPREQLP